MMKSPSKMIITPVQIFAIGLGLVNLALYFFHFQDAAEQIKYLLWVFMALVVYLHEDLLINLLSDEEEDEDEDRS